MPNNWFALDTHIHAGRNPNHRKLCNNTVAIRRGDDIAVFMSSYVFAWHRDEKASAERLVPSAWHDEPDRSDHAAIYGHAFPLSGMPRMCTPKPETTTYCHGILPMPVMGDP